MRRVAVALAVVFAVGAAVLASRRFHSEEGAPCGAGFERAGSRCCPAGGARENACHVQTQRSCPPPLVVTDHGCDAPDRDLVRIPATTVVVGPSDWEAEGRVHARTVSVAPFAIDRLEVTSGRFCPTFSLATCDRTDPARAAGGVPLAAARSYCTSRGGRLPTEDEWLAAAGGDRPRRYPWGDTGAVCRRAAWGLEAGPCAEHASGPDTVGAHPEGATPLGIHDLAGNVAEWVDSSCSLRDGEPRCTAVLRGGSYKTRLATELRTWLRQEVSADVERAPDPSVGFRCAYASDAASAR